MRKYSIAFETCVEGGSLSLFDIENNIEVDSRCGLRGVSKAEDVLRQLAELLESNKISDSQVEVLLLGAEAGSHTGARIGESIVKGLSLAWNVNYVKIPLLKAIISKLNAGDNEIIAAVPVGKNECGWLKSSKDDCTSIEKERTDQFAAVLNDEIARGTHFYLSESLAQMYSEGPEKGNAFERVLQCNLAIYLNLYYLDR